MSEEGKLPESSGNGVACWLVLAVVVLGAAALAGLARWNSAFISSESVRETQREEIRQRVEREQERLMGTCDWEKALKGEASRLILAKPHAVKESAQRARPVPLISGEL